MMKILRLREGTLCLPKQGGRHFGVIMFPVNSAICPLDVTDELRATWTDRSSRGKVSEG